MFNSKEIEKATYRFHVDRIFGQGGQGTFYKSILTDGTLGYLDPEYFQSSQFTKKSDLYSFKVVLVELLTGERAITTKRSEEA